ncbi:hypothetical protein CMUS01_06051 [Colletotrichum musicola]|uniref:Uncharacterized protein n=1 Tax=Colletotrichum musicola TaxID=2175873 RepID=A0A8H6KND0_9PEZI|nr:hypothetical protein CMUS01_06051 [Colletotrichum musicola]
MVEGRSHGIRESQQSPTVGPELWSLSKRSELTEKTHSRDESMSRPQHTSAPSTDNAFSKTETDFEGKAKAQTPPTQGSTLFTFSSSMTGSAAAVRNMPRPNSSKIYNFPDSNIWVGLESEVLATAFVQLKWPDIKEKLLITLDATRNDMIAEQSREKKLRKRDPKRRVIALELRMSGRRESGWSDTVKISPCIWILCGSKWCRDKIRKATKFFDLPVRLFKQRIEVHCGGPTFNANLTLIPRAKLHMDPSRSLIVSDQGFLLYHHIEGRSGNINSVCGMVCCITLVQYDHIILQHVSRIGGVLVRGFFNFDFDIFPLAVTTAHRAFQCLSWLQKEVNRISGDFPGVNERDCGSDVSSESEDDEDYVKEYDPIRNELRQLGSRQIADINEWNLLDSIGYNFEGKRPQHEDNLGSNTSPADYISFCGMVIAFYPGEPLALFMTAEDLLNDMYRDLPEIRRPLASNILRNEDMTTGPEDSKNHEFEPTAREAKREDMGQDPHSSTASSTAQPLESSGVEKTPAEDTRASNSRAEMRDGPRTILVWTCEERSLGGLKVAGATKWQLQNVLGLDDEIRRFMEACDATSINDEPGEWRLTVWQI